MYTDYESGGLDSYNGERIIFMDEFRGQMKYSLFLGMLQGYKQQMHARYTNIIPLWEEVHITSVLPPELVYVKMVDENKQLDTMEQLRRRVDFVVYHYKQGGVYLKHTVPMPEYKTYGLLKKSVAGDAVTWTDLGNVAAGGMVNVALEDDGLPVRR